MPGLFYDHMGSSTERQDELCMRPAGDYYRNGQWCLHLSVSATKSNPHLTVLCFVLSPFHMHGDNRGESRVMRETSVTINACKPSNTQRK